MCRWIYLELSVTVSKFVSLVGCQPVCDWCETSQYIILHQDGTSVSVVSTTIIEVFAAGT